MKISMINGLPIISVSIVYQNKSIFLPEVLLDTGCAISVFDTDIVDQVGLTINHNFGNAVRMYGVGGQSKLCFQQHVSSISINDFHFDNFILQLGMTKVPYGFDAIIGSDFCEKAGLIIDFNQLLVRS